MWGPHRGAYILLHRKCTWEREKRNSEPNISNSSLPGFKYMFLSYIGKKPSCHLFLLITFIWKCFYIEHLKDTMCLFSEKAMATHSSTLAWKIPWAEEPGRLQSMGSLRVGHNWVTSLSLFTFMHWRRKWQPTPVFLPGESWGRRGLVGCHLWGCTESDTTEAT